MHHINGSRPCSESCPTLNFCTRATLYCFFLCFIVRFLLKNWFLLLAKKVLNSPVILNTKKEILVLLFGADLTGELKNVTCTFFSIGFALKRQSQIIIMNFFFAFLRLQLDGGKMFFILFWQIISYFGSVRNFSQRLKKNARSVNVCRNYFWLIFFLRFCQNILRQMEEVTESFHS